MEFTSQQMSGGPKYSAKVKLGNYSEDLAREESEKMEYEQRRAQGKLLTTQKKHRNDIALAPVNLSCPADGKLHYGDTVMVKVVEQDFYGQNHAHFLANNMWDVVDHVKKTIACTATTVDQPVARNTWVISRPPYKRQQGTCSDILRYGDTFCLTSHPRLRLDPNTNIVSPPYYLKSERPDNILGCGSGNRNEVCLTLESGSETYWTILPANGDHLAYEGLDVPIGESVQIVHCSTNQPLGGSLDHKTPPRSTDWGPELVVHGFFHKPVNRWDTSRPRPAQAPNRWQFVVGDQPSDETETENYRELDSSTIVERVRYMLTASNCYGLVDLRSLFNKIDDTGEGALDKDDMKWGLFDMGVKLTDEEFSILLNKFDTKRLGVVSMYDLMDALRGEVASSSIDVIQEAWNKLNEQFNGRVTLENMLKIYDAKYHPRSSKPSSALSSSMTKTGSLTKLSESLPNRKLSSHEAERVVRFEAGLEDFVSTWEVEYVQECISYGQFENYYKDLSAGMETNFDFEMMVRNVWRLPGCEEVRDDGSLRVRVTLKSGRQKEVLIPPEIAQSVDPNDELSVVQALEEEMNILGIYRVRLLPKEQTRY